MATDPVTNSDIPSLVGKTGDQTIETSEEGSKLHFRIKKAS
jgi:TusA-related sulfurtransferase